MIGNQYVLWPRFIDWVKDVLKRRNKEEFDFDRKQRVTNQKASGFEQEKRASLWNED